MAKPQGATSRFCSKCSERPATPKHQWCLSCLADYRRDYNKNRDALARAKGFGEGVDAMRTMLVAELKRFGFTRVTCWEAAEMVNGAPRPRLDLLIATGTLPPD